MYLKFGFGLHSGIDEVMAMMSYWNKVSPTSPYLGNIYSVDEGSMRGVAIYVGFFWILYVGVSFK